MSLIKFQKAIKSISESFEAIEKIASNTIEGELKVKYSFTNQIEYNKVLDYFSSKYNSYKHNFELADGLNVLLLWD